MLRRAAPEQLQPAAPQSGDSDYIDGCRQLHRTANQEAAGSDADLLIEGHCHYLCYVAGVATARLAQFAHDADVLKGFLKKEGRN